MIRVSSIFSQMLQLFSRTEFLMRAERASFSPIQFRVKEVPSRSTLK